MRVENARPRDLAEIRRVFRETLALGRPVPFAAAAPDLLDAYESLCLDWFLEWRGCSAVGVMRADTDAVHGYALVCLDPEGFDRWRRVAVARYLRRVVPLLVGLRLPVDGAQFVALRARDGMKLWRGAPRALAKVPHAHLNMSTVAAGSMGGRLLADYVDDACRSAGFPQWYGEINAPEGRRVEGLTKYWGAEIVHRAPNHTLTWLRGGPVERLTVLRSVPQQLHASPQGDDRAA